jgi:hypothetical protein
MNPGQIDQEAMRFLRIRDILMRELSDAITPGRDPAGLLQSLDAYVDYRIHTIIVNSTYNGAQLVGVGAVPDYSQNLYREIP